MRERDALMLAVFYCVRVDCARLRALAPGVLRTAVDAAQRASADVALLLLRRAVQGGALAELVAAVLERPAVAPDALDEPFLWPLVRALFRLFLFLSFVLGVRFALVCARADLAFWRGGRPIVRRVWACC